MFQPTFSSPNFGRGQLWSNSPLEQVAQPMHIPRKVGSIHLFQHTTNNTQPTIDKNTQLTRDNVFGQS